MSAVLIGTLTVFPVQAASPDFTRQIAPILEAHCFPCHGPNKRKGGLRISNEKDARLGGDGGVSPFVAGDDGLVPVLQRITSDDEAFRMPPKGPRVSPEDVSTIRSWIADGAPWGAGTTAAGTTTTEKFWSFEAPVHATPPQADGVPWGSNAIDAFIVEAMQAQGLTPSPEADRNTLIRRLSLDLRGLPPTPEEVRAFIADTSPGAYEALVEQFLASPHYGERQAVSWLDVARYADTNGYEKDRPRSIWPYRDWVINAFNADMPFDRFVIEQIAGDLLPSPTLEQRIATGFHRNVMLNEEGGIDVEEFRYKNVVDRTNTTATALLGLTFSCAQCHTHKYDPISQREYYQFFAFFNNTDDVTLEVPNPEITRKQQEHESRIDALRTALRAKFPADDPTAQVETLAPTAARATQGGALPAAPDGIVDVATADTEKNTYIVETVLAPGRIDGLVLHVLNGDRGPGRAPGGNFVLSEFLGYRLDGDTRTSLIFAKAESEFSQANFPIENAIDGKMKTGWAIAGDPKGLQRDRRAVFYFDTPLELTTPQPIEIRLEQQHGSQHTLDNFRLESLSLTVPDSEVPETERRDRFFAEQFATWSTETAARCQPWQPLTPLEMKAKKHTTLVRLADNSILAKGNLPNNDIYDLKLRTDERDLTGLRLEVLPHNSLPGGGPGRGVILGEGDFLLTGIKISAAPWNDPEARVPVAIAQASESFANGEKTASKALDGKADTGWSIHGGEGKAHGAVFTFAQSVGYSGGTVFYVTLEQKYIHQHTLGRFRLSVTDGAAPESSGVPAEIESMLLANMEVQSGSKASHIDIQKTDYAPLLGGAGGGSSPTRTLQPTPNSTTADLRPSKEGNNRVSSTPKTRHERLEAYFLAHTPLLAKFNEEIDTLEKSRPRPHTTLALEEREALRTAHIHHRGEFLSKRAAVQPDVPEVLPPLPEFAPRNRLTLAKWLVSAENPLTARVTMNRLWQQLFGRGLVPTAEDFGIMGEAPTHPELLDWLAVEFMRRGWSTKDMVRLLVTSATYRQSARISPEHQAIDPTNVYLARSPRFRVDAELVRDIALAASGSLDATVGGPSVFPPIPDGLLNFVYGGFKWNTDTGANRQRRGMYTYWKRMLPYPTASVFDAPARDMVCVRRLRTNTPMQALTLLNDDVFMEAARSMADTLIAETSQDTNERLRALFMRCLSREPDATEKEALLDYFNEQRAFLTGQNPAVLQALLRDENVAIDDAQVERAVWTLLCRAVLNLDETITRG